MNLLVKDSKYMTFFAFSNVLFALLTDQAFYDFAVRF